MMRRPARARGFRPQTDWAADNVAAALTNASSGVGGIARISRNLTESADPEWFQRPPETVRRLRGVWTLAVPTNYNNTELLVALAVGVAPDEAVDVGPTALPDPIIDASWDGWLWHQYVYSFPQSLQIAGSIEPIIDSKAQRRLDDNVLFLAVSAVSAGGTFPTAAFTVGVSVRWLLSLSSRS